MGSSQLVHMTATPSRRAKRWLAAGQRLTHLAGQLHQVGAHAELQLDGEPLDEGADVEGIGVEVPGYGSDDLEHIPGAAGRLADRTGGVLTGMCAVISCSMVRRPRPPTACRARGPRQGPGR
jgi:hypothetical protein